MFFPLLGRFLVSARALPLSAVEETLVAQYIFLRSNYGSMHQICQIKIKITYLGNESEQCNSKA